MTDFSGISRGLEYVGFTDSERFVWSTTLVVSHRLSTLSISTTRVESRSISAILMQSFFFQILLDQLSEIWRIHPHACLLLVNQLILKQVPWLYKFPQHPSFGQFLKAMRANADDVPFCVGVTLILASLVLLTAPLIGQSLSEIFSAFLFLISVLHKKTPSTSTGEFYVALRAETFTLQEYPVA